MTDINGKVVVITGAASGIGRATAVLAARRGARLAISDVDEVGLAETVKLCGNAEVLATTLDVRKQEAVAAYARKVRDHYGVVNVVINNAGVALTGRVTSMTYEEMQWVMDIDYWGVVYGTKEFLPFLIESGDGHVVNISSIFGLFGVPSQSAYNSAKFAVRGFTEALRQEMLIDKLPVQVSCVHPGGIQTAIARNARASDGEDADELARVFDRIARTTAEQAGKVILDGVAHNRARILIGLDAKVLDLLVRTLGSGYQRIFSTVTNRMMPLSKKPTQRTKVSA